MPTPITPELLEKLAHISDDTVKQDIQDTQKEINQLKWFRAIGYLADARIEEREKFIAFLSELVAARGAAKEKTQ